MGEPVRRVPAALWSASCLATCSLGCLWIMGDVEEIVTV